MPSEKQLQANARRLRNQMTKQERRLWYDFLRTFEIQFYRQKVIENFIVDFYCAHAKIVVEVDGGQHFDNEGQHADQKRDARLTKLGYEVIRFTNDEVDHNFYEVCEAIRLAIMKRISWLVLWFPSPPFASLTVPPPIAGEGLDVRSASGGVFLLYCKRISDPKNRMFKPSSIWRRRNTGSRVPHNGGEGKQK